MCNEDCASEGGELDEFKRDFELRQGSGYPEEVPESLIKYFLNNFICIRLPFLY